MARLATAKEEEAKQLFKRQSTRWPREAHEFFAAAKSGHWEQATNLYEAMRQKYVLASGRPTNGWGGFMNKTYASLARFGLTVTNYWPDSAGEKWRPIEDVNSTIYQFQKWDPELMRYYATNLIGSIPAKSVFITGTAPGFFVIPAFSKFLRNDDQFILVSPNKLVDASYLQYASAIFGKTFRLPTQNDYSDAFNVYVAAATERARSGHPRPGENFTSNSSAGGVSIGGFGAVMEINALLLQRLFTNNPGCEFYYDENWRLAWTLPYLTPHGLLLKINHEPLATLSPAVVDADRLCWNGVLRTLTGLEMDKATNWAQISDFVEQFYLQKDFSRTNGNLHYATNELAQQTFARLRLSMAGVYAWRAWNSPDQTEKRRFAREADFAFRQSYALCPSSGELTNYGAFLLSEERTNDLQSLAASIRKITPGSSTATDLSSLLPTHQ